MNRLVKLWLSIFLLGLLVSCNDQQTSDHSSEPKSNEQKPAGGTPPKILKDNVDAVKNNAEGKGESVVKSVLLNAGKFQYQSSQITSGTRVFDVQLQEYAVVTNRIVVVLNGAAVAGKSIAPEALQSRLGTKTSIRPLANNVYEISFSGSETDMYKQYQTLLNLEGVSKTELQLQYGSRDQQAEY